MHRNGKVETEKPPEKSPNAILTKEQLAERWSISVGMVEKFIKEGLPILHLGPRTIRFFPDVCDKWFAKYKGIGSL